MALASSGLRVELREVKLNALPPQMVQLSPKGTVPVLQLPGGLLIDESLDIMRWSLAQSDPQGWLHEQADAWISRNDEEFKPLLDCYKYADRHPGLNLEGHRENAEVFIAALEQRLQQQPYLVAERFTLADAAVLPFVRQFAGVEPSWFEQSRYAALRNWLKAVLDSAMFRRVMQKYPLWKPADAAVYF